MKFIVTVLFSIISLSFLPANKDREFKICHEARHTPPYYLSPKINKNSEGTLTRSLKNAASKANLKINFVLAPWSRCLRMIRLGEVDAIAPMIWKSSRDEWLQFPKKSNGKIDKSKKLLTARYIILTHIDSTLEWNEKTFTNVKIGLSAPKKYLVREKLKKLNVLHNYDLSFEKSFSLIIKKRLDGFIVDELIGKYKIKSTGLESKIKILPKAFLQTEWYVPFSKSFYQKYPTRSHQFWAALTAL